MESIAILLARIVSFMDVGAIDPRGLTSGIKTIREIGSRYNFEKSPKTVDELDFEKGINFTAGSFKDIQIDKITLYNNAVLIDTRSSTDHSLLVLNDMVEWASDTFGSTVKPSRLGLNSQISFQSDLKLANLNPLMMTIAELTSTMVSGNLRQTMPMEAIGFMIGSDKSQTNLHPAVFSFERRAELPFSDRTYHSTAPLPTTEHIRVLAIIEKGLL